MPYLSRYTDTFFSSLERHEACEAFYWSRVFCTLIVVFGLVPLFYVEPLLGRRIPASMEMLYTLVVIHLGLFVIRTK